MARLGSFIMRTIILWYTYSMVLDVIEAPRTHEVQRSGSYIIEQSRSKEQIKVAGYLNIETFRIMCVIIAFNSYLPSLSSLA